MPQSNPPKLGAQYIVPNADFGSSAPYVSDSALLACAGCGAVFKAKKIIEKNPSARQIPADVGCVTCPLCLRTCGWENVS